MFDLSIVSYFYHIVRSNEIYYFSTYIKYMICEHIL